MNRKFLLVSCFVVILGPASMSGEENNNNELRAPLQSSPPLNISLPQGVKIHLETVADYSVYRCELAGDNAEEPLAVMTVYIGQNPSQLSNLVKTDKFFDQVAWFHNERTTWFSWFAGEGDDRRFHNVAYLYNIYTTHPNRENPYVILVYVVGRDIEAANSLKAAAQTIQAKR